MYLFKSAYHFFGIRDHFKLAGIVCCDERNIKRRRPYVKSGYFIAYKSVCIVHVARSVAVCIYIDSSCLFCKIINRPSAFVNDSVKIFNVVIFCKLLIEKNSVCELQCCYREVCDRRVLSAVYGESFVRFLRPPYIVAVYI